MPNAHTWGVWLLVAFITFLVLELWAVVTNRTTLSQTVWRWEAKKAWRRWLVFAGLELLVAHLCFGLL